MRNSHQGFFCLLVSTTLLLILHVSGLAETNAPLSLSLVKLKPLESGFGRSVVFRLTNSSARTWQYVPAGSSIARCWQLRAKTDKGWIEQSEFLFEHMTMFVRIQPGESKTLALNLPGDGVERMVGVVVHVSSNVADYKALWANEKGEAYTAWCPATFLGWELIDKGLLAPKSVKELGFDPAKWRTGSAVLKIGMAEHLERSGELKGKTRDELFAILGTGKTRDGWLAWLLGFQRDDATMGVGFPMRERLRVKLDEQGVATETEIYRTQEDFQHWNPNED